jgi:hypothetical protein
MAGLEDPQLNATLLLPPEEDLDQLALLLHVGAVDTKVVFGILARHFIPDVYTSAEMLAVGSGTLSAVDPNVALKFTVHMSTVTFTLLNTSANMVEADLPGCAGESVIHRINQS